MPVGAEILQFIDNCTTVWAQIPGFDPLVRIVREDRQLIALRISELFEKKTHGSKLDAARSLILDYAAQKESQIADFLQALLKEPKTVLDGSGETLAAQPEISRDKIYVPCAAEVMRIVITGLFGENRTRDLPAFLVLFREYDREAALHEKSTRFKSMVWFACLLADLVRTESEDEHKAGVKTIEEKLEKLLDRGIEGTIIDGDRSRSNDYEGGKWNNTLFGWLQSQNREGLAAKLKELFNFGDCPDNANRLLLAEHRRRMIVEGLRIFPREEEPGKGKEISLPVSELFLCRKKPQVKIKLIS